MLNFIKKIKTWQWLLGIIFLSFILFFRSFSNFYTNDDFYHFVVSRAGSVKDIFNFFNLSAPLTGYPHYRPLTIQLPYFLDWKLFDQNPLPFHILSFFILSAIVVLVYRLAKIITKNKKVALLAAFFYATSASHFGHLNISAPAEIGYTLLALLSVNFFIDYLARKRVGFLFASIALFSLGLLAKENSIIVPTLLFLVYVFFKIANKEKFRWEEAIVIFSPFLILLAAYLYMRFFHYGLAQGDSYVWNFSPIRALNTIFWYKLWSFNLPEMLVDFVGPGIKLNPNLLKYYSKEIIPILVLFGTQALIFLSAVILSLKSKIKSLKSLFLSILFGALWFVLALVPVLFLPVHKFTFYLALPIIGFVMVLAIILNLPKIPNKLVFIFAGLWLATSFLTLKLTYKTNWITQGALISQRVLNYFQNNNIPAGTVLFYDKEADKSLPWLPSKLLRDSLSDNNFFKVYYGDKYSVYYGLFPLSGNTKATKIEGRQFLGY